MPEEQTIRSPKTRSGVTSRRGRRAGTGATGATGQAGATGETGATGAAGGPGSGGITAYGEVTSIGDVVAARSLNISSAKMVGQGQYCVLLDPSIDLSVHVAVATSESGAINSISIIVGDCGLPGRPGILVNMSGINDIPEDESFYLVVP